MKISLLFITYNHAAFIARAIRSAMAQDHPDLELVICDDASTDSTVAILKDELRHCPSRIPVVWASSVKNAGLIANFNRGMGACTGEIIVPMSGDDISMPHRASAVAAVFSAHPQCMLVVSDCMQTDAQDRILKPSCLSPRQEVFRHGRRIKDAYAGAPVCGAAAAYRAALHDKFGPMIQGPHGEDNCYWNRALMLGEIHCTTNPLVQWRAHEANLSNALKGADSPAARRKHIRFLRKHEQFLPQWQRDVERAMKDNLIAKEFGCKLLAVLRTRTDYERLLRHSLTHAGWKTWCGTAMRILRAHPSPATANRLASKLKLWLSAKRQAKYWRRQFPQGS